MSSLSGQNITGSGQYDAQDSPVEPSLSGQSGITYKVLTEDEISRLVTQWLAQVQLIQVPVAPAPHPPQPQNLIPPPLNQPAPSLIFPLPPAPATGSFPVLPPFSPAPGSSFNGESLFDRFPLIKTSLIMDIVRHEFEPLDLVKLDPTQGRSFEFTLDFDHGVFTPRPYAGSHKDYPTLNSLLEPLTIYFDVLSQHAFISGDFIAASLISRGSFAYIRNLSGLHKLYQWTGVLNYHRDFFLSRRREMMRGNYSGWLHLDNELVNCDLIHLRLARRRVR